MVYLFFIYTTGDWFLRVNVGKHNLQHTSIISVCYGVMIVMMEEIMDHLIGSSSHYLQGFLHPRWCRISSINSSDVLNWFT